MAGRAPGTYEGLAHLCAPDEQIPSLGTYRVPGAGPGAIPFPLNCRQVGSKWADMNFGSLATG